MPFERKGKCVYRKDTGKKKGCSKTVAMAKKYMKALYVHSKDSVEKQGTPLTEEDILKYGTREEIEFLLEGETK